MLPQGTYLSISKSSCCGTQPGLSVSGGAEGLMDQCEADSSMLPQAQKLEFLGVEDARPRPPQRLTSVCVIPVLGTAFSLYLMEDTPSQNQNLLNIQQL